MCRHQFHDFKKVIKPKWGITEYCRIRHNLLIAHWLLRLLINWREKKDGTIDIKQATYGCKNTWHIKKVWRKYQKQQFLSRSYRKSDLFCGFFNTLLYQFIIHIGIMQYKNKISYAKKYTYISSYILRFKNEFIRIQAWSCALIIPPCIHWYLLLHLLLCNI